MGGSYVLSLIFLLAILIAVVVPQQAHMFSTENCIITAHHDHYNKSHYSWQVLVHSTLLHLSVREISAHQSCRGSCRGSFAELDMD